ncbi:MAG: hypothetical protein QOK48_1273 [Blastocatellia bacterium]|jgi:hypothetical protein|nr:hypothetical protein [Blastocatellia bacterium]
MRFTFRFITCLALCCLTHNGITLGQEKSQPLTTRPSSCSRDGALEIIQQQIAFSKTIDNSVQRITVLIRAADLLWPFQQPKSRAAFSEAFDLAVQNFKEKGAPDARDGKLIIGMPDQRYTVIGAIAKRDSIWAKKLTEQMLKEEQREAADKPTKDVGSDVRTAERLLTTAMDLLVSDETSAMNFARTSLQYPATFYLSMFHYQLASRSKPAADQFYQEALTAYARAPIERLLYLSSYPFGNDREAGETPGNTVYQVPAGFTPNPVLQRLFLQTILGRVQTPSRDLTVSTSGNRLSEPEQILLALTRLEKQVQQSLPDLAPAVESAKENLFAQLSPNSQQRVSEIAKPDSAPQRTFDERVEAALKNPNVDLRDQQLTFAITGGAKEESLDHLLSALDKISDSNIRQPLLNWLYFERAQRQIKEQKLDEAKRLAAKVEELDQRAWLYSRIAEESLKQNADQTQARAVLDEVVDAAAKAPNTGVTARALLGVAYLYTKIDMSRAIAVMAEAVRRINQIEQPDFSRQFVVRKIEGKSFGTYASFVTPGFTPESAFREIGKVDFDGMLNQAANFSDKALRALTTLAVVEQCLKDLPAVPRQPKAAPTSP